MSIEVFPLPPSGPSLAEITSAITSNAAPATVTMPAITSSITTNAASSGVTMAAINSAITTNAASSGVTMAAITSAITTNAASSGVTLAAIGTQVANNATPFGGTWTQISAQTLSTSVNTVTVSGLGSYKYLRVIGQNIASSSSDVWHFLRFNGDSSSIYNSVYFGWNSAGGGNPYIEGIGSTSLQSFYLTRTANNASGYFVFDIDNPQASVWTTITGYSYGTAGGNTWYCPTLYGTWKNTAAITSITIFNQAGNFSNGFLTILGAN